jgi:hypothetical protein
MSCKLYFSYGQQGPDRISEESDRPEYKLFPDTELQRFTGTIQARRPHPVLATTSYALTNDRAAGIS